MNPECRKNRPPLKLNPPPLEVGRSHTPTQRNTPSQPNALLPRIAKKPLALLRAIFALLPSSAICRSAQCERPLRTARGQCAGGPRTARGQCANMARSAIFAVRKWGSVRRKQCAVRTKQRAVRTAPCENRTAHCAVRARGATPAHTISPRQKHRHECARERREAPRPWRLIWWIRSRQSPWAAPPNGGGRTLALTSSRCC